MTNYIHIGRIVATFGTKGEMVVSHVLGHKTDFKKIEAFFIEYIKGEQLPYFIQQSKAKSDTEIYIKLEGIDSKEAANNLLRKNAWLLQDDFQQLANTSSPIALLGFQIITDEEETVGIVEEVIEQPHQVLLRTTYHNNEALIPLHAETLDSIDQKARIVYVTLPDGLLDVFKE